MEEQKAALAAESTRIASEELKDQAPIIDASSPTSEAVTASGPPASGLKAEAPKEVATEKESISVEELRGLSQVVSSFKADRELEEEMEELKEERGEYCEVRHTSVVFLE